MFACVCLLKKKTFELKPNKGFLPLKFLFVAEPTTKSVSVRFIFICVIHV